MARPWTPIDRTAAISFAQQGFGQGVGSQYKPWLDPGKVWSQRPVTALKGWTTGRVHYLTGKLTLPFFYIVEWSSRVIDIREHYPLHPLEETLAIAKKLGIHHPVHGKTREPIMLVSDFLLTVQQNEETVLHARALLPTQSLEDRRLIQLLEIERCYWAARNIDWGIVTEHEIPAGMAQNVQFLHGHMINDISSYLPEDCLELLPSLAERLTRLVEERRDQPLNRLTHLCAAEFHCSPATPLTIAYHLLATRQWQIDMNSTIDPDQPLELKRAMLAHK